MKPGEKVKILCRGNDIVDPWHRHLKIKCTKVFPKHLWGKGGEVVDGDFSGYQNRELNFQKKNQINFLY